MIEGHQFKANHVMKRQKRSKMILHHMSHKTINEEIVSLGLAFVNERECPSHDPYVRRYVCFSSLEIGSTHFVFMI
jgi:hypothetical protein